MNEYDVMIVMDTMAQMYETLVKRIEDLSREVEALKLERKQFEQNDKPQHLADLYKELHQ